VNYTKDQIETAFYKLQHNLGHKSLGRIDISAFFDILYKEMLYKTQSNLEEHELIYVR
jgi:hypothetical protein